MTTPSCCLVSHTLQNGIGPADANRLLAGELAVRNYRVSLCGINDANIPQIHTERMVLSGREVNAQHIPQTLGWEKQCAEFRRFLDAESPDVLAIRFIPYSLDPKGIVWKAARFLPEVLRGRKVIWLVDEIWLGDGDSTIKHRLVGLLQRQAILRLLRQPYSHRVFTNNNFNTAMLRHRGVRAATLRLFGNIPVATHDGGEWLFREFEKASVPITRETRERWLIFGIFGVFHSDWNPDAFFSEMEIQARQHGKEICIAGIGSLRSYDHHWKQVAAKWGDRFRLLHLGCRDESEVSQFLQSVDFGLTTNPCHLMGKSGTCMAMLDHGLPIVVPRANRYDDIAEFPPQLVWRGAARALVEIFSVRQRVPADPQLPKFVDVLTGAIEEIRSESFP